MSSIAVCVRMRPFLPHERAQRTEKQRITLEEETSIVKVQLTEQKEKIFKFNNVFGQQTNQVGIYSNLQALSLIERVVEGYHSTIFAYGQTGSGKTYTIEGGDQPQTEGLVPKAIKDLFKIIEERSTSDRGFKIFLSFVQIYNESIYDLIDPNDGKPLKMRWNKLQQFTVQNMFEGQCRSAEQALKWWHKGQKNKIMGSHKMNNTSSRSHCLLTLRVQSYPLEDPSELIESKLEIVDLAGSERYKVTKSTGVVFKEGIEINKSLFTLRQVIASLYEVSTSGKTALLPPYRDSKLTSLLKQSIGGNSYCLMIACLNPTMTHFQQSLQTLTYASMATYINNIPVKNIDPKIQENVQLKEQNYQLKSQLKNLEQHVEYLTRLLESNECPECKKKKETKETFTKKTEIEQIEQEQPTESQEPTGLMMMKTKSSSKEQEQKSQKNQIKQTSMEKTYEKLLKERNANPPINRTLKSTKEIIESIAMIRDLISANSSLRQKIEFLKEQVEKQEKQTFTLMKENQVLRDRWEMVSANIKGENEMIQADEAPIAAYQRMIREHKGEGLRLNSLNSQISKVDTQQSHAKISYNQFLRGNKKLNSLKKHVTDRRRTRIYSEVKKVGSQSFM